MTAQHAWHRQALHDAIDRITTAWPKALEDAQAVGYPTAVLQPRTSATAELTSVEAAANLAFPDDRGRMRNHPCAVAAAWLAELHDVRERVIAAASETHFVWLSDKAPELTGQLLHKGIDAILKTWTLDDLIDFDPDSPNHRRDVFGIYRLDDTARRYWPPPDKKGDLVGDITVGERGNEVEICGLCRKPVTGGHGDPIRRVNDTAYHGKTCWFSVKRRVSDLVRIIPKIA